MTTWLRRASHTATTPSAVPIRACAGEMSRLNILRAVNFAFATGIIDEQGLQTCFVLIIYDSRLINYNINEPGFP